MKKEPVKNFTIQITEEGLNTITSALECYSRLGLKQFNYAFEYLEDWYNLNYEEKRKIEDYLNIAIPGETNHGIYNKKVEKFTKAYEIKKELEKYINLSKTNGISQPYSNIYDGALYPKDYLPVFIDENGQKIEHKKEFKIPCKIRNKLKKLNKEGRFIEAWELIDKNIDKKGIRGRISRISDDLSKLVIENPYKL